MACWRLANCLSIEQDDKYSLLSTIQRPEVQCELKWGRRGTSSTQLVRRDQDGFPLPINFLAVLKNLRIQFDRLRHPYTTQRCRRVRAVFCASQVGNIGMAKNYQLKPNFELNLTAQGTFPANPRSLFAAECGLRLWRGPPRSWGGSVPSDTS